MNRSLGSKIEAANTVLMVSGNIDAIGVYFTTDYVAHLTDQDLAERLLLARKR